MSVRLPEGTVIVEGVAGTIMIAAYYPYRKTPDAYIAMNDSPLIHCLQCDRDIYRGALTLIGHVRGHDRRKKVQRLTLRSEGA